MGFLDGKVGVVTGAAQGLGTAYARALASEGADVAVCDVKPEVSAVADEIAATSGRTVRAYPCDVSDTEAVLGFVDAVLRDFGGVDVVVMNAGIYGSTPMDLPRDEALSEYQRFMDTNVKSIYVLERAFAPSLVEREGDIVVISTDHILPPLEPGGTRGGPSTDLYDASKWVLNGYIQAWALGFAANGQNVRVNGIAMGATDTPMLRGVFPGGSPPDDVVAGWMTPAQQAQLMLDLLQDGRTGDLISSEPGHPVELPPRSGMGQPVSNLPAEQFHHGLMGLEPAIWEPPS
ncbi:MAG: SDR family NAD(P)-dependent oxidoreductase [Chloroflexi bacterium]|nr:SDR family NAD(P)-dependent oxidoreductase [Chloroflexota bacterium]